MDFGDVFFSILQGLFMRAKLRRHACPMHTLVTIQTNTLFRRRPQSLRHRSVGSNDPVLIVQNGYEVWDTVEGSLPIMLSLTESLFGIHAFGDIIEHCVEFPF